MERNKLQRTLMLSVSILLLLSCNPTKRHSLNYIKEAFHTSLDGQLEYNTCEEQWTPLNGNGYRICIFDITDMSLLISRIDTGILCSFTSEDYLSFEEEIRPYIQNNSGFYHCFSIPLKSKDYIFITKENRQLIHFYIVM